MFRDQSLMPKEAIRLTALGLLAGAPKTYAELADEVAVCVRHGLGAVDGEKRLAVEGVENHAVGILGANVLAVVLVQAVDPRMVAPRRDRQRQAPEHLNFELDGVGGIGERREQKLDAYRQTRDQILKSIIATFGPGEQDDSVEA